jgi:hypothetical protein
MKTRNLLALIMASATSPAPAETLKKVPAALNPAKAYILVEYKLMPNPHANLPGSRKTLPLTSGLTFARYDARLGDIRGLGRAKAKPLPGKQSSIEPFHNRELVRGDAARLHLIEVEPDLWVIQAFGNTSFSLVSYAFRLEPGTVTDLGIAEPAIDWPQGERAADVGDMFKMALLGPFAKRPPVAPARVSFRARTNRDIPVPDAIPSDKLRPVKFEPGVKFGNYLGGLINRIEGVNATSQAAATTLSPAR